MDIPLYNLIHFLLTPRIPHFYFFVVTLHSLLLAPCSNVWSVAQVLLCLCLSLSSTNSFQYGAAREASCQCLRQASPQGLQSLGLFEGIQLRPVYELAVLTFSCRRILTCLVVFIFAGALMGFVLARFQYLNINNVLCLPGSASGAAPGECYWYMN